MELQTAFPFRDIADELIDTIQNKQLVFSDAKQFQLLKGQFRTIGYNFNLKPIYLFCRVPIGKPKAIEAYFEQQGSQHKHSSVYAESYVALMSMYHNETVNLQQAGTSDTMTTHQFELSTYKMASGVYYFLDEFTEVIYVAKAKNIRKRLQSPFSKQTKSSAIEYANMKGLNKLFFQPLKCCIMKHSNIGTWFYKSLSILIFTSTFHLFSTDPGFSFDLGLNKTG